MSYGHGRKDTVKRAVEAGRFRLPADHPLLRIRTMVRELAERMAISAWDEDPSSVGRAGKDLYHAVTSPLARDSELNAVWAEAARLLAEPVLGEQHQRRAKHLFGILKRLDKRKDGVLVNVPERMRADIDLTALSALARDLRVRKWDDLMTLAGAAFREEDADTFRADLLRGACTIANERFSRPTWVGPRADRARVRLSFDARSVRGGQPALTGHLDMLNAARAAGVTGRTSVLISAPCPRGPAIPLPVTLLPGLSGRYGPDAFVGSLCVEIGPDDAVVRAVMEKRPPAAPHRARYVMGWDYGYRNTLASVLIDLGREMNLADARRVIASVDPESSEACRRHLTENVLPGGVRILRVSLSDGSGFMRRMNEIAGHIDVVSSEIGRIYDRVRSLKREFLTALGWGEDDLVPEACPDGVSAVTARHHRRFWNAMRNLRENKARRRALYRSADGVKSSWFGFLLNREMGEARRRGALLVAEDLTVLTPERGGPQYKGPAFNKMINNGAKGRFFRSAEGKAKAAGAPLVRVPSRHTSTTDPRYGVVDKGQRRGDAFVSRTDGARSHADAHAAFTIAAWPFLVPRTEKNVRKSSESLIAALAA